MKRLFFTILLSVVAFAMYAQSARDCIRLGNRAYRSKQYDVAETMYLKSVAKSPSFEAYYNLGNTYVMQQKDSTAFENYKMADSIGTNDPMRRARNFHNMGNIWYAQGLASINQEGGNPAGAFQNAVNYYKSSLRCNPNDNETRYNLAMAQYQLKKNQDKNGNNNQNKNDDKKDKDKQNQDKQKQDQKKDQDKKDQDKQNQDKQQQQQQQQQPQPKKDEMTDQVAEQLLNSAQHDEKAVQRKVNKNQNSKRKNLEKDW
ncbi:MAG: aerotolerance regulator BatC [Bacteroidaceae bacterium]|nr:aerotolerance regulator BatC [Bacteroidaceae bacterium]